jgi:hypothetical protein
MMAPFGQIALRKFQPDGGHVNQRGGCVFWTSPLPAPPGLQEGGAWFCAGERVRALGPDNAITASGRIFARLSLVEEIAKQGIT